VAELNKDETRRLMALDRAIEHLRGTTASADKVLDLAAKFEDYIGAVDEAFSSVNGS
jgi:hypothetical protein